MMPKTYQKLISIFLLTAILLGPGYFLKPKKADAVLNAGAGLIYCLKSKAKKAAALAAAGASSAAHAVVVPVGEVPNKPQITTTAVMTTGTEDIEFSRCIREYVLNPIAWFIAKTIIRQFTKGIVSWINSGFEGNPTFVDPDTFLTDVADQASGAFIKQLGLEGVLCSPFRLPILASLELSYKKSTLPRFQCTLGAAKENWQRNWDEFMYDFTNGGWDRWLNVTTQPQNNPYGAYLMAYDELQARRLAAQEKEKMTVSWGSGFRSLEECSGDISGDIGQEKMCDTQCGHLEDSDDCFNSCMEIEGWDENLSSAEKCKLSGEKMQNTTPGKVIQDQLSQTLGTDLRQLELADEFNEIIAALIGQIFNWGSKGLRGQKDVVENKNINKDIYVYEDQEYAQQAKQEAEGIIRGVEKEETLASIDEAIIYETQYRDAKTNSLKAYNDAITKVNLLKICYEDEIKSLNSQGRTSEANQLQSTINNKLIPLINALESQAALFETAVQNSNSLIKQAGDLKTALNAATSYETIAALISQFKNQLQPQMHNAQKVADAQNEYTYTVKPTLDDILNGSGGIQQMLNQCLAGLSI